jgi:hypothetical protein
MNARIARAAVAAGLLLPASLMLGPATSFARRAPVTSRAQGSTCTAWIQERANYPLKEQYRVGAECSLPTPGRRAHRLVHRCSPLPHYPQQTPDPGAELEDARP